MPRPLTRRDYRTLALAASNGAETRQLAQLIEHSGALPPLPAAPMPIAILRPPRLVGRDRERAQLAAALASGHSTLVGGEPGIGKTRLLEDHAARVDGAIVVPARPGDARLPYAVMARALRSLAARFGGPQPGWLRGELARVLPELGTANPGRRDAGAFQRAVAESLSAWARAGLSLVVLDDAQFADEATLAALPALCGGTGAPIAWCIGCRAGDVPTLLDEWRHAGDRDALAEIRLGPLDPAAVETLLEALEIPGLDARRWAQPLWCHTGGNPLFVLETLRALIAGGTQTVDVAVSTDLDSLRDQFKTILPDTDILISSVNGTIALRGRVPNLETAEKAVAIAKPYGPAVFTPTTASTTHAPSRHPPSTPSTRP